MDNEWSSGDETTEASPLDQGEAKRSDQMEETCVQTEIAQPKPADPPEYTFNESLRDAERHYVYFWKQEDVFSQWHEALFEVDGQFYCCAEQYMMHQKAVIFHNDKLARRILDCTEPHRMKSLGRQTEQFDEDLWVHNCLYVVKTGNIAKFSGNLELKEALFSTYPKVLVEASPYDKVWGIGLKKYDPSAWNEVTWDGKNLLGYILTEVRDELMCKDNVIPESCKKVFFEKLSDDLKKNSFGRKHKFDRPKSRQKTAGSRHHPNSVHGQERNFKVNYATERSDNTSVDSDHLSKSLSNKNQVEQHEVWRQETAQPEESRNAIAETHDNDTTDRVVTETSANDIDAFDKTKEYEKRNSELSQVEQDYHDRINKNETPRNSELLGASSNADCHQEPENPEDRLYKPLYRVSITEDI